MDQDQEREFEQFKIMTDKLVRAFANRADAEELGFYVAQAIRNVPNLLRMLDDFESHSNEEVLDAIHAVVANHFSLSEANRMLTIIKPKA